MGLSEEQKNAFRAQVEKEREKLMAGLAPAYLGRFCPLIVDECQGPKCQWFALSNDDPANPNKVTGGSCSVPLGFSQIGQLGNALFTLAQSNKPTNAIIPQ